MATRKLFWDDPYRTTLQTHVTQVIGNEITVAETILYAFAGGQESDSGTIGKRVVTQARREGHEIIYTLDDASEIQPGSPVEMCIDWPRRYALMRLHFAAELVLETTYRTLPGITKIGAHIAQDKARIDFDWSAPLTPLLPTIQERVQHVIDQDLAITSAWSDEANQRRYWEIAGYARVACGGTHLKRTGEVGTIGLKRKNVGKGKERIEITLRG